MTDRAHSDDSAVLDPPAVEVRFLGEQVTVRPLQIRQIPPFTRLVRMAAPALMRLYAARGAKDGSYESAFLDLIADHGETIIAVCAVAVDRDAAWVDTGNVDELLALVIAIVEVNQDFFAKRVAPMLSKLQASPAAQAMAEVVEAAHPSQSGDGPTPSTT
jgi:hypothetical protein